MVRARTAVRAVAWLGAFLPLVATTTEGQERGAGEPPVIDPMAELELLFDGASETSETEGPSVAFDGTIFFVAFNRTDLDAGGTIWRFDPEDGKASIFRSLWGLAAGSVIDSSGDLLIAELAYGGGRRISRIALETGDTSVVADSYEGRPFNGTNDLVIDEKGRIYFTEYDIITPEEVLYHRGNGVYRVDPDGGVERVIEDAGLPNGIAVSPDQRTLYVTTNQFDILGTNALLSYDLSPEGEVRFRSVLAEYEAASGQMADGMAIDVDGNLYVALFSMRGETGIAVYDPSGERLAFIPTPTPAKNVTFGRGSDALSLYITAGNGLYRFRVNRTGYHLPSR